jgi:hypothetical protein
MTSFPLTCSEGRSYISDLRIEMFVKQMSLIAAQNKVVIIPLNTGKYVHGGFGLQTWGTERDIGEDHVFCNAAQYGCLFNCVDTISLGLFTAGSCFHSS